MTPERIREWAYNLGAAYDPHYMFPMEKELRSLIAEVRREVLEECIKEVKWIVPRGQAGLNARLVHAIRELNQGEVK